MKVIFLDSVDWSKVDSPDDLKKQINDLIRIESKKASEILGHDLNFLNIIVQPNDNSCTEGYDTGGYTAHSELIIISFNPLMKKGRENCLNEISQTLWHEINHTSRWSNITYDDSVDEAIVFEGLATVFERDNTGVAPPYGQYRDNKIMQSWLAEIRKTNNLYDADFINLKFHHPDGRKWVLYKVGAWLIDRAAQNSNKTVAELTKMPANTIIELAQV